MKKKEFLGSVRNQIMLLMCVFFSALLILLWIATDRYLFSEEQQQKAVEAAAPPEVILGFPVQDIKDIFGISAPEIQDIFCITVTDDMKLMDFDSESGGLWEQPGYSLTIDYTGSYEDFMKLCDGEFDYYTKDGYIFYADGSKKRDTSVHMYDEAFRFTHTGGFS